MCRYKFLAIVLFTLQWPAHAQSESLIDSLSRVVGGTSNDSIRIEALYKLSALFVASHIGWSQTISKPEEVSPQFLKESFENALITVMEVNDTYIKVKDIFDFYIDIDASKRYVSFSASYPLAEGTSAAKAHDLMNKLNTDIILIKFYYTASTNSMTSYYYFWLDGGFTKQNLLKTFKMMAPAMNLVLSKDTDKLIK